MMVDLVLVIFPDMVNLLALLSVLLLFFELVLPLLIAFSTRETKLCFHIEEQTRELKVART